eukprot:2182598-Pleurochrysis_carterae.AAC.1
MRDGREADGVVLNVLRVKGGKPEAMLTEQLLALSDAVVPRVLSYEVPHRGAAALGLRAEGMPAALVPLEGGAARSHRPHPPRRRA